MRSILLTALLALALAGCGEATEPTGDGSSEGGRDPAGSWVLVASQPAIDVPPDARITLEVTAEGDLWQVGGTSACNSYGGQVVADGVAWHGEEFFQTDMGCEEPRMAAEHAYLDALRSVDAWARTAAGELVLTGPDTELRFEALPPVPTAELTDTTWVLDALMTGVGPDGAVSSTVAGAAEATLRLDADGTLAAATGCRTFDGEWVEAGDEVMLTTFGQRADSPSVGPDGDPTCDDAVLAQEGHVLSVLGDGFRAEIDGDRLTITSRDGLGLRYRAAA